MGRELKITRKALGKGEEHECRTDKNKQQSNTTKTVGSL